MDTTETTPTTDLVIIDAEIVEDDTDSFGTEIAKTVATTAATSAVILGGIYAYKYLKPRIASLLSRSTETEAPEAEESPETTTETPETQKV